MFRVRTPQDNHTFERDCMRSSYDTHTVFIRLHVKSIGLYAIPTRMRVVGTLARTQPYEDRVVSFLRC